MENNFRINGNVFEWELGYEKLRVEAWGPGSFRVRATTAPEFSASPGALLDPAEAECVIEAGEEKAILTNGSLSAEVSYDGTVRFFKTGGETLLEEALKGRTYKSLGNNLYRIEARFKAYEGEQIYGLGQHRHGFLDQKGCVLELAQHNSEISIPFMVSSRGYGFLWNSPAIGRVELANNGTRWTGEAQRQIDYFITTGDSYAEIMSRYADATGHAPEIPEWALGFWQSKLRYASQDELLEVAREHHERGLPMSVIVIDFFHSPAMGDWGFDPTFWPDPGAMVHQLEEWGIKVMVSIWPSINRNSANYEEMARRGLLVRTERGAPVLNEFIDTPSDDRLYFHYYDPTNPEARRFIWQEMRRSYFNHGVKVWWLDACEPEMRPEDWDNLRYYGGNGLEVGCLYPKLHQQAFYEGMLGEGEREIITLSRSAWAGSQRYAAAVWSGDIPSTFESLQEQVKAGLNIGLSGIPWWTTDIGGFFGENSSTPYFRELLVRWFQFGVFCPLFRLHGYREPHGLKTGGPNEIWSFGEEAYVIIKDLLFLRERLRPYLQDQMRVASERGIPVIRPLFFDFESDPECYRVEDQFMCGPDLLVAPVLYEGAKSRKVYLPEGLKWKYAWNEKVYEGGQMLEVPAPLDTVPVFTRATGNLPLQ